MHTKFEGVLTINTSGNVSAFLKIGLCVFDKNG